MSFFTLELARRVARDDGDFLLKLMPWASPKKMHQRVHRAYWYHEYAMRSYYLDARLPTVVTALEALVNTSEDDCAWQFRDRVRQLASEFKVDLNDGELKLLYKLRSKLVHASSFLFDMVGPLPNSPHSALYLKAEDLLRSVVRRCLLQEDFGDFFRDAIAVEKRWPLNPKPTPARSTMSKRSP
jgi:hypothetical protein